jgi:hypothetical protein
MNLGYYNHRMVVYGKFFTLLEEIDPDLQWKVRDCQENCTDSGGQAIDLIYVTFHNDSFCQTWCCINPFIASSYLSEQEILY